MIIVQFIGLTHFNGQPVFVARDFDVDRQCDVFVGRFFQRNESNVSLDIATDLLVYISTSQTRSGQGQPSHRSL
jgi:hypothetical protein